MKKLFFAVLLILVSEFSGLLAQSAISYENSSERMLEKSDKLTIGGYGQIDFNQPVVPGTMQNGTMDVHRMVLLFGYKFDERTSFITEIELEHVSEIYVEQAFLNYRAFGILPSILNKGDIYFTKCVAFRVSLILVI